jgi:hypothetical protein
LFINIRKAASWGQPLHVSDVPRGARMERTAVVIGSSMKGGSECEDKKLSTVGQLVKLKMQSEIS